MVIKKLSKKLKDVTGLGKGEHHYQRAFELVKEGDYNQAINFFKTASKKFKSEKNLLMEKRANSNILIYKYLDTKKAEEKILLIKEIIKSLEGLQEIERMCPPHDLVYCREVVDELTNVRNELLSSISEREWDRQRLEQEIRIDRIKDSVREIEAKEKELLLANNFLRSYLSSKDLELQLENSEKVIEIFKKLPSIIDIEVLGRSVETERIILEVEARRLEIQAHFEKNHIKKVDLYQKTAKIFKKIGNKELYTFKYLVYDKHINNSEERYLFNSACAIFYEAVHQAKDAFDFKDIINKLKNSAGLFSRCGDEEWRLRCEKIIQSLNKKATCWLCKNEIVGQRINFNEYSLPIPPYFRNLASKDSRLSNLLNLAEDKIVLCKLCSSLLQNIVAAQTNKLARRYQEEMDKKEKILRNYLEDSIKETKEGLEKIRGEFYDIRAQVLKEMNSIQELDSGLKNLTDLNLEGESEEVKEGKDGL
jgi:hypothetical protein